MRMSKLFIPTMREVPSEASIISHQLMLKAGLIRKLASGIYTFLPLGLRVIKKIEAIIREEMNKAGAQEILMPLVQPADLWQESGRLSLYGPELLKFKDRKESLFCLGPTHEEVVTALVRDHVKSYKNLPLTLYQVQTKFRDEIRPRFGLMRGREFIMKDAYSFAADKASQDQIYQVMWDAYHNIFTRCGLDFRAVRADTGSIGGDLSHEFQVLAQSGEDAIVSCSHCSYCANIELAAIKEPHINDQVSSATMAIVLTPNKISVKEQALYLGIPESSIIKTIVFMADDKFILALVLGDQEISETKLKAKLKVDHLRQATEAEASVIGPKGFIGPFYPNINIVADVSLKGKCNLVAGANKKDTHYQYVDVGRDINPTFLDIKAAQDQDPCVECGQPLTIVRGIEVGHIFYLGKKYSQALNAKIQNAHADTVYMEMGCYGIGVGRTAAAAIEQHHDDRGIIWPLALAPFHVHLVQVGEDKELYEACQSIHDEMTSLGIEVLWDDRDERVGVKFNDADLLGCPLRLTLGSKGLKAKMIEAKKRKSLHEEIINIPLDSHYIAKIKDLL